MLAGSCLHCAHQHRCALHTRLLAASLCWKRTDHPRRAQSAWQAFCKSTCRASRIGSPPCSGRNAAATLSMKHASLHSCDAPCVARGLASASCVSVRSCRRRCRSRLPCTSCRPRRSRPQAPRPHSQLSQADEARMVRASWSCKRRVGRTTRRIVGRFSCAHERPHDGARTCKEIPFQKFVISRVGFESLVKHHCSI